MNDLVSLEDQLIRKPETWLVSGVAGFIGSHISHFLLRNGQTVVGVDNFATGSRANITELKMGLTLDQTSKFIFHEKNVSDLNSDFFAQNKIQFVLHQAGLGSVSRSIESPLNTNEANLNATLKLFDACRRSSIQKIVFASSSSVYGDLLAIPQIEENVGTPCSPYAVSKRAMELYALNFHRVYNLPVIGLRYFNVFGPRQNPSGPYSAVIPRWINSMLSGTSCGIHGDGENSRDFCFVENVVRANIIAALSENNSATGEIYNITMGGTTSLNLLHSMLAIEIKAITGQEIINATHLSTRVGDIRSSRADISKAKNLLGYKPKISFELGLKQTVAWYSDRYSQMSNHLQVEV